MASYATVHMIKSRHRLKCIEHAVQTDLKKGFPAVDVTLIGSQPDASFLSLAALGNISELLRRGTRAAMETLVAGVLPPGASIDIEPVNA